MATAPAGAGWAHAGRVVRAVAAAGGEEREGGEGGSPRGAAVPVVDADAAAIRLAGAKVLWAAREDCNFRSRALRAALRLVADLGARLPDGSRCGGGGKGTARGGTAAVPPPPADVAAAVTATTAGARPRGS